MKRKLSIREVPRTAVTKMVREEVRIDPRDRFLTRRPKGRSGLGNLSREHNKYLYGKKRPRSLRVPVSMFGVDRQRSAKLTLREHEEFTRDAH